MTNSINTWVNAKLQDKLSVFDRGLSFGDGLFETMRVSDAGIPLLDYHMKRFISGAELLGMAITLDEVLEDIQQALSSIVNVSTVYRLKYIQ